MAAREHYISTATTYDDKDSKLFQNWLDDVSRLSSLSGKTCNEVAVATSKGPLHKYTQELVNLGNPWNTIKIKLERKILKCSNAAMAKHKLSNLKQSACSIHEYISKFSDLAEHAYQIKPSRILASNFIEGIDNPHVRTKLDHTGDTLDAFFVCANQETEKQKI